MKNKEEELLKKIDERLKPNVSTTLDVHAGRIGGEVIKLSKTPNCLIISILRGKQKNTITYGDFGAVSSFNETSPEEERSFLATLSFIANFPGLENIE